MNYLHRRGGIDRASQMPFRSAAVLVVACENDDSCPVASVGREFLDWGHADARG